MMTMFGILLISAIIAAIAWYYGTEDWEWIAGQNASLILLLMVFGFAFVTLVGWMKRH